MMLSANQILVESIIFNHEKAKSYLLSGSCES